MAQDPDDKITMLYKITEKHVYCELRCSGHGNIFNCIECKEARDIVEETRTMTQQQYIDLLKEGNTFITKVETAYDTNKKISNNVKF